MVTATSRKQLFYESKTPKTLIPIMKVCITHNRMNESVLCTCTFFVLQCQPEGGGGARHHPLLELFCIIGEYIVNIIITHLQMNSNFTSCQKESNELLHEDFTESKSPDILIGVQSQLYTSSGVFLPLTHFHFIHLRRATFQVGTKKGGKNSFAGNT